MSNLANGIIYGPGDGFASGGKLPSTPTKSKSLDKGKVFLK